MNLRTRGRFFLYRALQALRADEPRGGAGGG